MEKPKKKTTAQKIYEICATTVVNFDISKILKTKNFCVNLTLNGKER